MNAVKIEKEYKKYLNKLKNHSVTAESIQNNCIAYNDAAEKTFEYLNKVALRSGRNRRCMSTTGYEFDVFADDITMHILRKLDSVLACGSDHVIPFIITLVNNEVITICRKWERTYPTGKKRAKASDSINGNGDEEREPEVKPVFNFLDDAAWSLIADDTNLEESIIHQESVAERRAIALEVLKNCNSCSRFELVSFLATKVITNSDNRCMKTRALAEAMDKIGLYAVSEACFENAAAVFEIPCNTYFGTFANDLTPAYSTIEELCDKISKASYNCSVKLCKKLEASCAAGKRIRK